MSITAPLLEVCVPSGIFCWRNIKKVENGETARGSVAFAQGAKMAQAAAQYNDTVAKTAHNASSIFNNLSPAGKKAVDYTGKAVKWATKNVNPLICISSGIKVATSDDKIGTGISEAGALAGMFAGEGLMKLHQNKIFNEKNITTLANAMKGKKGLNSISKYMLKSGNAGKIAAILKGVAFVSASIASYSIGQKIAEGYKDKVKAGLGIKTEPEENKTAEAEQKSSPVTAEKIDRKA
ncbi:hypothetical protein IAC76_00490 [Spirochaetes bacterium]|uniref:Uncharacterized protein n=1 Tax=Candidatus Scatousia excrementipullorum TaxID=2840936 RepID=A0A9D9DRF3_9BACT|nr:hypothetical protein [Candidatus Scatousia excrementipullorum]